ncbi:DUF481 domain-containing protein [Pontiellaceae bacterium B1224]|nr:DUF481 domain-containing protein [Pontiellaceae bacterium B1224]
MKKTLSILIPLLVAVHAGLAQDTILLNNGDKLTGTILKQTPEQIDFKSPAFGTVSLNPHDIKEIKIADPSLEKLGEITVPAEAIAKNEKTTGNLPKTNAPPAPPAKKEPVKMKKWTGQAGLAIAIRQKTSSNQIGVIREEKYETYRLYGNIQWKGKQNNLNWDWVYRYSSDEYQIRDDFFSVAQVYKHSFNNNNLYSSAKTLYLRDYNRRIENEFLQTGELGITWFDKDSNIQLETSAGAGYRMYQRLDPARIASSTISQPEFIFDANFRWNLINTLALTQSYTHLGNLTNYQFVFSTGFENKLVQDLFVRMEYRLDRDTEVYYDDKGYYDKALLTSLLYKF